MRTGKYFKYLMAMIVALGTSVNAMAQTESGLKIYFSANNGGTAPQILVTDYNNTYDLPANLTVTVNGAVWANKARYWEMFQQDVTDRVIAAYTASDQKESKLTLTFGNFPYEVNMIQWNVMNDLLSSSILDILDNYRILTKCVQSNGGGWSSSDQHWDMNFLAKETTFTQKDVPWEENGVLNGLKSFEIGEQCWRKSPLGILFNYQVALDDQCRTFIKAGWNGKTGTGSNIHDSDDENWAFKVKFTLPDVRMRCRKIATGSVDNNIIVQEEGVHRLEGYISAHPGAVQGKIDDPQDPDDFHFEYTVADADKSKIEVKKYTGEITKAKAAGTATVRVTLMRGDRVVSYYDQTIRISAVDPNAPEIAIAFANGKKGYDITVGDTNAQIQGVVTKNGKDSNGNEITDYSSYHYEYSVDDTNIATIDPSTGVITALKEGDVNVSAVLKDANGKVYSKTYTYTLHVFAMHEGLEFRRISTYKYSESGNSNYSGWKVTATNSQPYEWQSKDLLRVNTSISGNFVTDVNNWKQIASFSTNSSNHWRGIVQEIAFDLYVPKYTKASARYSMAGNVSIGTSNKGNCRYGFELYYLNEGSQISLDEANNRLLNYSWDTYTTGDFNSDKNAIIRWGTDKYNSSGVGDGGYYDRATDNVTSPKRNENRKLTVYFAAIAYLWNNYSYPGDVSIGFKGIPEYTYYSTITYHKNDGTGGTWGTDEFSTQSKTETKALCSVLTDAPTRTGYTFMGWSTDPNPETATVEYALHDNFRIYDAENGGGMGPVNLYAVWIPNSYTVELRRGSNAVGGTESVTAIYGMSLPEGEDIVAPTRVGYDFTGYYRTRAIANSELRDTTYYYDKDMKNGPVWDRTKESDLFVQAKWVAHTTKITLDPQGGNNYGVSEVTATYGQAMPTMGVQAPQRTGYEFGGYFTKQNGKGTKFYNYAKDNNNNWVITSAKNWNIDQPEYTLYAYWIPIEYMVRLDKQGGTGGSTSVIVTYGEPLPSGETAPTKPGYEFKGYYSNENQEYAESVGQNYGGTQYYDEDMNGVEPWDKTENATIYAHWAPATYVVTFDAGSATLPQGIIDGNKDLAIEQASDGIIKIRFTYGVTVNNIIDNSKPKKPAYQLLGFYDENDVLVATVSVDDPDDRHIHLTGAGNYWEQNGTNVKWVHDGDLTLTAKYERKFTVVDGNMIKFGSEAKVEYVEPKHDWLMAVVNDLVGAAQEVGSKENPVMVFDMTDSKNIWTGGGYNCQEVMESLQASEYSDIISPNVLVYFNEGSYNSKNYETNQFASNAITADNKCLNLYVTDRYQMKIPYAFDAAKALYERNKLQIDTSDPMWQQSFESLWGTLCLPYPVKNNNTHTVRNTSGKDVVDCKVIFYELRKKSGNVMQFYKLPEDAVIPANTPILYERKVGVSSAVTIEERSDIYDENVATINIPANPNYAAETKFYDRSVLNSAYDWQFIGNMQERTFYGKNHSKKFEDLLPGEEKETSDNIYYFKKDNFTRMGDKNYMILYPYRAYFREVGGADSDAKVGSYSILVVDEEGATDITNAIYGDGEGDGKIYDLNGIRVMQPVKGRLYIVNGKKKIYK